MSFDMDYDNYIELYEAVYFFDRICCGVGDVTPLPTSKEKFNRIGIRDSVYAAVVRILVVTNMLDYDGSTVVITNEQKEKHRHILDNIIGKNPDGHYEEMFRKASNQAEFFFDSIIEMEYDVYSRYNFQITFHIGQEIARLVSLGNSSVLELGGNSGGLGTALLDKNRNCRYTVLDTRIPCMVGNELKADGNPIQFIEGNIFDMILPDALYDCIIAMNLLHDFDDIKCSDIIRNCNKYCGSNAKFYIIEDILMGEYEPQETVMHGLRLSASCSGGKQRTIDEMVNLFSTFQWRLERAVRIDSIHMMLVMGFCDSQRM